MEKNIKIVFSSKESVDVYFADKIVRIPGELGLGTFLASSKSMKWMKPAHLRDKALSTDEQQDIINLVDKYYKGKKPEIYFEIDNKNKAGKKNV